MQRNRLQQKSYTFYKVAKEILQSDFFGHVYCLFFCIVVTQDRDKK